MHTKIIAALEQFPALKFAFPTMQALLNRTQKLYKMLRKFFRSLAVIIEQLFFRFYFKTINGHLYFYRLDFKNYWATLDPSLKIHLLLRFIYTLFAEISYPTHEYLHS